MKTRNCICILVSLQLFSCVTFKQFDGKAKNSRDPGYNAFIVKQDGKVVSGESLKHKNHDPYDPNLVRAINKDNAFTIDGTNYSDVDVVAFQDKKAYHKRHGDLFLVRLVQGKINLYYFDQTGYNKTYTYSSGPTSAQSTNKRKSTFYFDKGKGPITTIGISELREAVKDNANALDKLNGYYPKDNYSRELHIEKLVSIINLYNQ